MFNTQEFKLSRSMFASKKDYEVALKKEEKKYIGSGEDVDLSLLEEQNATRTVQTQE